MVRVGRGSVCMPPFLSWPCGVWPRLGFPWLRLPFSWLRCVAVLCGVGGPSPVRAASPVRCGGPSSTSVVARRCFFRGGGAARGGGLSGGCRGRCPPPLFFWRVLLVLVPGLPVGDPSRLGGAGGSVDVALGSFVLRSAGGRCCLFRPWSPCSLLPPPSFFFLPAVLAVSAYPWSVACLLPRGGLCGRVRGIWFFPARQWLRGRGGPLCLAGRPSGRAGVLSVSYRRAPCVSPVVSPGWGGCPPRWSGCVALQLCGCFSCFPQLSLPGGCALVGRRGLYGCFVFVGGWGFPPSLSSFLGSGFPVPPSALPGPAHALVGERRGQPARCSCCGLGARGPCPGSVRLVADGSSS